MGVGVTVTSIALPVALSSSSSAQQALEFERNTHSQETQQAIPSTTASGIGTEANSPEKDCYGGFLSEEGKGELVFCVEKKNNEKEELDFYLYWEGNEENKLNLIKDINVMFSGTDSYEIWFTLDGETSQKRKIMVKKEGQNNLHWMSFQDLKNICTKTQEDSAISLACTYKVPKDWNNTSYTYTHSVTAFQRGE